MSRDRASTNHQQAGVIQQPVAVHPQQRPAVFLTSSTKPTQLPVPVGGHQLSVGISTAPVAPPPVIGPSINQPPNYALVSDFNPDFGSYSGYRRNRNLKENGVEGQQTFFHFQNLI